jgi:hypothetical protein
VRLWHELIKMFIVRGYNNGLNRGGNSAPMTIQTESGCKMKKIKRQVWLFVLIPALIGVVGFFVGLIKHNFDVAIGIFINFLIIAELIAVPVNLLARARYYYNQQGDRQFFLCLICTGLVCWVEYYIVKNLVLLSAAYLTGGNL